MVYLFGYLTLFAIASLVFIILKSSKENEINFLNRWVQGLPKIVFPVSKGIPAILATLFVFLTMPQLDIFFVLIMVGLVFCLMGDMAIMKNLLLGLVFFLGAHIFLVLGYSSRILVFGSQLLENGTIMIMGLLFGLMFLVDLFFYRYLQNSEKPEFQKMKSPVLVYMALISLHVIAASVLAYNLFLTSLMIIVIVIGSVFFFASDALIAVHEFHHNLHHREIIIMTTYYLALLFISLITQA